MLFLYAQPCTAAQAGLAGGNFPLLVPLPFDRVNPAVFGAVFPLPAGAPCWSFFLTYRLGLSLKMAAVMDQREGQAYLFLPFDCATSILGVSLNAQAFLGGIPVYDGQGGTTALLSSTFPGINFWEAGSEN